LGSVHDRYSCLAGGIATVRLFSGLVVARSPSMRLPVLVAVSPGVAPRAGGSFTGRPAALTICFASASENIGEPLSRPIGLKPAAAARTQESFKPFSRAIVFKLNGAPGGRLSWVS